MATSLNGPCVFSSQDIVKRQGAEIESKAITTGLNSTGPSDDRSTLKSELQTLIPTLLKAILHIRKAVNSLDKEAAMAPLVSAKHISIRTKDPAREDKEGPPLSVAVEEALFYRLAHVEAHILERAAAASLPLNADVSILGQLIAPSTFKSHDTVFQRIRVLLSAYAKLENLWCSALMALFKLIAVRRVLSFISRAWQ